MQLRWYRSALKEYVARTFYLWCASFLACACAFSPTALADAATPNGGATAQSTSAPTSTTRPFRLAWGAHVSAFGKTKLPALSPGNEQATKGELEPSVGGHIEVSWTAKYIGLGLEARIDRVRFAWGSPPDETTTGAVVSFLFTPRLVYPLRSVPLELYAVPNAGLAIPALSLPYADRVPHRGASTGALVGATYFTSSVVGINLSTGLQHFRLPVAGETGPLKTMTWTQWTVLELSLVIGL